MYKYNLGVQFICKTWYSILVNGSVAWKLTDHFCLIILINNGLTPTVAVMIMAVTFEKVLYSERQPTPCVTFEKVEWKPAKAMCQCNFYEDIKLALNRYISWGEGDVCHGECEDFLTYCWLSSSCDRMSYLAVALALGVMFPGVVSDDNCNAFLNSRD